MGVCGLTGYEETQRKWMLKHFKNFITWRLMQSGVEASEKVSTHITMYVNFVEQKIYIHKCA